MGGARSMAVMLLLAGGAWAAAAETQPAADAGAWQPTLGKLASPDFAERQAGQRELSRTTWRDYAMLKKLAADADDEEVKERLQGQVQVLEDAMAVNPPPITMDVTNVPLSQAVAALGQATGTRLLLAGGGGPPVSLHAMEAPFGQVLMGMTRAGTVTIGVPGQLLFDPLREPTVVASGPFMISLMDTAMTSALGARQVIQVPVLRFVLLNDPRITLARQPAIELKTVTDDRDDDLIPKGNAPLRLLNSLRGLTPTVEQAIQPGAGHSIVTIEGVAHIPVQVRSQLLSSPDASKMGGTSYRMGDVNVSVSKFTVTGTTMEFAVSVNPADPAAGAEISPVIITCKDDQAATLWSTSLAPNGGTSGQMKWHGKGVVHVELSRATRVQVVDVPFSFKNLSLPVVGK